MITYHHIGGRNGTFPLPLKKGPLLNDFHLVLYDADENCFEQMQQAQQKEDWGQISVYPYCIGGVSGEGKFHLNFHPTTNSLYPFNEDYKDYNFVSNALYGEYLFGDACKLMRSVPIELMSLEDALSTSNIPAVDFLSLDVQGAEYDILAASKTLLESQCVGVQLEVEFVKLYKDQKTFSDINQLMDTMGFELLELDSFGRCSPVSLPIGFRGLEQPLYAEAVYVRKIEHALKACDIDFLYKAAFFCLIYKKMGHFLRYLNKINALAPIRSVEDTAPLYKKCLYEIWAIFEESKHVRLPKLSELFSNEKFQDYYGQKKTKSGMGRENDAVVKNMLEILPEVKRLGQGVVSPLERTLQKYGLGDVAKMVEKNRLFETQCFLELQSSLELA